MTQPTFTLDLVRSLRGSPLTCLIAIMLLEQSGQVPITAQLLKDVTGYKDHTITDSLRMLELPTCQIVVRVTGGWRLATGFQLPLEIQTQNRENRDFAVLSSSSSNRRNKSHLEEQQEQESENREKRGFRNPEGFEASLKKALELNIREPKASQVADMKDMTPELIQAHVDQAQAEGHPLGTAIYRLLHDWSPMLDERTSGKISVERAVAAETGHKIGCNCIDCSMARSGMPLCSDCHHIYQNCECTEKGATT